LGTFWARFSSCASATAPKSSENKSAYTSNVIAAHPLHHLYVRPGADSETRGRVSQIVNRHPPKLIVSRHAAGYGT
jgi:hypothetical protein